MAEVIKYGLKLVKEGICEYEPLNGLDDVIAIEDTLQLSSKAEEELWVVCLDTRNRPIGLHMAGRGCLDALYTNPREIFKRVLLQQCA